MKNLLMSLVIVLLIASNAFCLDDNSSMAIASHIGGGAIVAGLVTYYLPNDMNPYVKWSLGFIAGSLAGAAQPMRSISVAIAAAFAH